MSEQSEAPEMEPEVKQEETVIESMAWPDSLPADLQKAAAKFASPLDVLKSYVALERRLGSAVMIPEDGASEAEQRQFHRRIGVPDRPEDYDVDFTALGKRQDPAQGEEIAARREGFLAAMQAAGATPGVVQAALDWFAGEAAGLEERRWRSVRQSEEDAETELHLDWGGEYDRNLELARRALKHFGGENGLGEAALADGCRLGSHTEFLRLLARVGQALLEDQALLGGSAPPNEDLQRQIDDLHALPPERYKSPEVQSELRRLYRETLSHSTVGAETSGSP